MDQGSRLGESRLKAQGVKAQAREIMASTTSRLKWTTEQEGVKLRRRRAHPTLIGTSSACPGPLWIPELHHLLTLLRDSKMFTVSLVFLCSLLIINNGNRKSAMLEP